MRINFTEKIKNTISRRAGFKCSNPQCRKLTVGSHNDQNKSTLVGVAAHISAASPGGPRYDETLSVAERSSINNSIWLCGNCSILIDKDPKKFPKESLLIWRQEIEAETALELRGGKKNEEINAPQTETLQDKVNRINLKRQQEFERNRFLSNPNIQSVINEEIRKVIERLIELKPQLEDTQTYFHLATESIKYELFGFGFKGLFLRFNHSSPEHIRVERNKLSISLLQKKGHEHFDYREETLIQNDFQFDRDLEGNNGWTNYNTGKNFIKSYDLIDIWVSKFMDEIEKRMNSNNQPTAYL